MSNPKNTRKQALDEGRQRDISDAGRDSGLMIPVFITSTVWDICITPDEEGIKKGENEQLRLKSVLDKLLYFIRVHRQTSKSNLIYFPVSFSREGKEENVQLLSRLGPIESTDRRPCITIMTPEEFDRETSGRA